MDSADQKRDTCLRIQRKRQQHKHKPIFPRVPQKLSIAPIDINTQVGPFNEIVLGSENRDINFLSLAIGGLNNIRKDQCDRSLFKAQKVNIVSVEDFVVAGVTEWLACGLLS